jgi:hypothetical protein
MFIFVIKLYEHAQLQSVQRRIKGWKARVRFPARVKDCFVFHRVLTGSGAHLAYYTIGIGGSLPPAREVGA